MRRILKFEVFLNHIRLLEKYNIIEKDYIFGYKKTFTDVLKENNLGKYINKALYVISIVDGKEYCYSNGYFKKHLLENNMTEKDYLMRCNIVLPCGYNVKIKAHGKEVKKFFQNTYENWEELYFSYRSILTSVSIDYEKIMYFYGISREEALKIETEKIKNFSESRSGEKNSSYGKRGINAHCYRKYLLSEDPKKEMEIATKERIKRKILKWASDNDIDETNYNILQFDYFSTVFKNIHKNKGMEFNKKYSLESIKQGIFLYNREKSIKNYDAKNFYEHCIKILNAYGNEKDKEFVKTLISVENYEQIMSYCCSLRENKFPKIIKYRTKEDKILLLRSKLEHWFVKTIENLHIIDKYQYENIRIPYYDIDRCKQRTYVIDFEIFLKNGKRLLIEVKPYNQAMIPEGEILYKKQSAEIFAKTNNYSYGFITEKDLKNGLVEKIFNSM